MFSSRSALALVYALQVVVVSAQYRLVREYSGPSFFDNWNYYGSYDNLTNGDVMYTAVNGRLTYVDPQTNHSFIRVDNFTNVAQGSKRNSVRINTNELYGVGSVWVGDFVHVPFGCSVWGAFWSTATEEEISPAVWPTGGEIDTFEAYNLISANHFSLHTNTGCSVTSNSSQISALINSTDCDSSNGGPGCTVSANDTRSYGLPFAQAGGGIYVTEFDANAISMWFFSRNEVPKTLADNVTTVDTSQLGLPAVTYPVSSCAIGQLFKPQSLVFDITLCGPGNPEIFNQTCTGICYNDWVLGEPSNFDNAYFEVRTVRVFARPNATIVAPSPPQTAATSAFSLPPIPTAALGSGAENGVRAGIWAAVFTVVAAYSAF
ncbi:concanavalin A-like lectin/glucanase domain-containing protein [Vararia minispora EC-137]|uniref:Concanavalin A-like lectin/glucanase domain-containing protein n=1 Tax=Vararia minispora EC-137 TaxID=1314806 RepID=A0ACB8QGS7_9AGAM|nr:concanavalin A-like lectin/glucanase domain-containing protein [Vararia minispora EC-137]